MKKLLVPTDYSKASRVAVDYAAGIANELDLDITLMHAYHPVPYMVSNTGAMVAVDAELQDSTASQLKVWAKDIEAKTGRDPVVISKEGLALDAILNVMEEQDPWLTVVGTHGSTGLERVLFGSVTQQLLEEAQHPVLVVPSNAVYKTPKNIVYATDYHHSDVEALRMLAGIAETTGARVTVVHIADGILEKEFEEAYMDMFRSDTSLNEHVDRFEWKLIDSVNVSTALDDYVHKSEVDLLCIAKRKRSFFEKIFSPSVSRKLTYHSDLPTLVFNAWDFPYKEED